MQFTVEEKYRIMLSEPAPDKETKSTRVVNIAESKQPEKWVHPQLLR